jgi:hypothetical protein
MKVTISGTLDNNEFKSCFKHLPCRESPGAVNLNSSLKQDRPDKPVSSEEGEPVALLRRRHQLHVVSGRRQPLEQEDGEGGSLDGHDGNQHPRQGIEWFYKNKIVNPV